LGPSCACWGSILPERQKESQQEYDFVESDTQNPCQLCKRTPKQTCYLWRQTALKYLAEPEGLHYKGTILSFRRFEASYSVALDSLGVKGNIDILDAQVAGGRPEEDAWILVPRPNPQPKVMHQPEYILMKCVPVPTTPYYTLLQSSRTL
jgi:hypothetical protein